MVYQPSLELKVRKTGWGDGNNLKMKICFGGSVPQVLKV
jgi:hypothetical protein